jgi:hypothetical protein
VANNEVEFGWLDEGFNEFSDSRVQSEAFQPNYLVQRFFGGFIPWQFRDVQLDRLDTDLLPYYRQHPDRDSISMATASLWPGTHQNITYAKTALMLHTLERIYTWEVMQRVMSVYFTRFKFKHPQGQDFFNVLDEVTGKDHKWFIDQVVTSSNTFDYSIESVKSEPIESRGMMEAPAGGLTFQEPKTDGQFRTTVVARRLTAGQFPVDVLVTFSNGEQAREKWDGRARWAVFTFDRPVKAVSAQVDPERVLLLDVNYTNNSRLVEPASDAASTKWTLRWMVWLQDLFMSCSFFV